MVMGGAVLSESKRGNHKPPFIAWIPVLYIQVVIFTIICYVIAMFFVAARLDTGTMQLHHFFACHGLAWKCMYPSAVIARDKVTDVFASISLFSERLVSLDMI